ncbi:MAG: GTPase [Candidatus Omnitrophota bacterium]
MIIDRVKIYVKAGDGGEGDLSSLTLSARRIIGGGGDGGDGGNVIIKVNPHLYDLNKFLVNKTFTATNGARGSRNNKKGKRGEDITVNVPEGTLVFDEAGNFIADVSGETQELLVCRGGRAGKGTYKKTYSLPAEAGEEHKLILDYRAPNDVAVLGMPNSGKTSLVNALTRHSFKVADYPFTTTSCAWAKATYAYKPFTVLDTPPLNEKTHSKGLNGFLKHLTRSSILLLVSENASRFQEEFAFLKKEIIAFDEETQSLPHVDEGVQSLPCAGKGMRSLPHGGEGLLKGKKIFYLLSKVDTIEKGAGAKNCLRVSAATGLGIETLKKKIVNALT